MNDTPQTAQSFYPAQTGTASLAHADECRIRDFIETIVRRTRLWHSERNDVRMELQDHFDDGVDAGQSADALLRDFGSPTVAAKLIRKAKIRSRSWKWHTWHRSVQALLATACAGLIWIGFLYARLHSGVPGPRFDVIGKLDETTSKVPEKDRAWPYYRAGMLAVDGYSKKTQNLPHPTIKISVNGPADPDWKSTVELLEKNTKALELFVEGSTKPHFGHVYRDANNDEWLARFSAGPSAKIYPVRSEVTSILILLPHINELNVVRSFLQAAAIRAIEKGNLPEFKRYWEALANLGRQLLEQKQFLASQGMGKFHVTAALRLLRRLISEHADLLTDADLQAWHQELRPGRWKSKLSVADAFRTHAEELLLNGFTKNTDGDGRITPEGCRMLRIALAFSEASESGPWKAVLAEKKASGMLDQPSDMNLQESSSLQRSLVEITWLRWSATLASRKEMEQQFNRLLTLLDEYYSTPAATRPDPIESKYHQELLKLAQDPALFRRYWPILITLPRYGDKPLYFSFDDSLLELAREATLATIALEQFRRRSGNLPQRLDELVPALLPTVPGEQVGKQRLIYRVINGKPLLYSFGFDQDDDGGTSVRSGGAGMKPDGDLRYLPIESD